MSIFCQLKCQILRLNSQTYTQLQYLISCELLLKIRIANIIPGNFDRSVNDFSRKTSINELIEMENR